MCVLDCRIPLVGGLLADDWGRIVGKWFYQRRLDTGEVEAWFGRLHLLWTPRRLLAPHERGQQIRWGIFRAVRLMLCRS